MELIVVTVLLAAIVLLHCYAAIGVLRDPVPNRRQKLIQLLIVCIPILGPIFTIVIRGAQSDNGPVRDPTNEMPVIDAVNMIQAQEIDNAKSNHNRGHGA